MKIIAINKFSCKLKMKHFKMSNASYSNRYVANTKEEMSKPKILMLHRVKVTNKQKINDLYFQRKMVTLISDLYNIIDNYLEKGCKAGSIKQCLENDNYFHLSFDDGFKEHLEVAAILKKKYKLTYDDVSFSINIANSINQDFTGMDLIYSILKFNQIEKLNRLLSTSFNDKNIDEIKKQIAALKPDELILLSNSFVEQHKQLRNTFLNKLEIIELSKIFKITSHGVTHRFLTNNKEDSEKEILQSKIVLENLINKEIDTFCYPEGKNDGELQNYCARAAYKYALSIRHEENNNFCIGRIII